MNIPSNQELVSVISPCYNVAPYIGRFLDSLIAQTYKKLEIILINDGSTDATGDIIMSYIPRLKEQGYKVIYQEQENGGQSSAINNALKLVTGQFLAWPDPDDWLTPDSIEKRVNFLKGHPDVALVRANVERIDAETGASLGFFEKTGTDHIIEDAYEKLLHCRTWFAPVTNMARVSLFDKVVPGREIYVTKRGGQNWQLMLPLVNVYPFYQMGEVLGFYCERNDSHSHSAVSPESKIEYCDVSEEVLINTLERIPNQEQNITSIQKEYALKRFFLCLLFPDTKRKIHYFKLACKHVNSIGGKMSLLCRLLKSYIRQSLRKVKYSLSKAKQI